jgi:hypothetical protein
MKDMDQKETEEKRFLFGKNWKEFLKSLNQEKIIHFFIKKGYNLQKLKTCGGGKGCNEFLFIKSK